MINMLCHRTVLSSFYGNPYRPRRYNNAFFFFFYLPTNIRINLEKKKIKKCNENGIIFYFVTSPV